MNSEKYTIQMKLIKLIKEAKKQCYCKEGVEYKSVQYSTVQYSIV